MRLFDKHTCPTHRLSCFRLRHKIEFRSLADLSQIVSAFYTGSIEPGVLCSGSDSNLFFVDRSKSPRNICRLDCRGAAPKLLATKIFTQLLQVADMCFVPDKNKPLLLASDLEYGSLVAFNTLRNEIEWSIQIHARSITTELRNFMLGVGVDGITMVSLSDNKILGFLIRNGDKCLGKMKLVQWCNTTQSLVVAHEINKKIHLSTIQFE